MKFHVPNYSCLQNPWLDGRGLPPSYPRSLSSTEFVETPTLTKFLAYATGSYPESHVFFGSGFANTVPRKEPCSLHTLNALLHEGHESIIMPMSEVRKIWDKKLTAPRNKCFISGRYQIRILTEKLRILPYAFCSLSGCYTAAFKQAKFHFFPLPLYRVICSQPPPHLTVCFVCSWQRG